MGQQQGAAALPAGAHEEAPYGGRGLKELRSLAVDRGLLASTPALAGRSAGDAAERSALIALLKAFDAGLQAASDRKGCVALPEEPAGPPVSAAQRSCEEDGPDETVVPQILSASGLKGVDIGGSLVKMALAVPRREAERLRPFPEAFGATGHTHYDLDLEFDLAGEHYVLHFFSGATAQVANAVASAQRQRSKSKSALEEIEAEEAEADAAAAEDPWTACCPNRLYTAGGGAHKFAPLFRDALSVELVPVKELSAVVDGLLFLASLRGAGHCDVFALDEAGEPAPVHWPETPFPLLLVNIGSGVSILRVDSAEEGGYTRVGGTACGGATFLGLARAMTSARTFQEALQLAEDGDATRCDLLVRDIYGEAGSDCLGLPGGLTAANCGRLCEELPENGSCSEQDLARSLLQMVTQQAVLLSGAFARHAGCVDRVFFAGGFVEEANHIARKAIAANFRSLGGRAYFLRHSDFLGALGSLRSCMRATGAGDALCLPRRCPSLASESTVPLSSACSTVSASDD